jgi:peptidoglycan/LPS O-acetylase OafA/YrhL
MSKIEAGAAALIPRNHLVFIDTIRFLAAADVMLGHAVTNLRLENGYTGPMYDGILYYFFYHTHYAVAVFLVLSGYCLMLPVVEKEQLKKGWGDFFYRRCRRILPPYLVILVICLACLKFTPLGQPTVSNWQSSIGSGITSTSVLLHFLMLQDAFPDTSFQINYVLWSIGVEFRIYMLFALFLWSWRRFGPIITTSTVTIGSLGLAYLIPRTFKLLANHHLIPSKLHDVTPMWVNFCGLFTMGMLAATLTFSTRPKFRNWFLYLNWNKICFWSTGAFLLFRIMLFAPRYNSFLPHSAVADDLVGLWIATVLIWACSSKSQTMRIRTWMNQPCLAFLGVFSYSLYLMHPLLLQVMWAYVIHPMNLSVAKETWVLCSLGGFACLAGSYIFHLIFERPFMNVRKPNTS